MLCEFYLNKKGGAGAQLFKWHIHIENASRGRAIHTDMEEYL